MKKQGYKDRADESKGMNKYNSKMHNEKYMSKGMSGKVMGHDKKPQDCSVPMGQGFSEVKMYHQGYKGNPKKAFDYKW